MTRNEGAAERLAGLRGRIMAAAESVGRTPASVELIAVTKTFAAEDIRPVLDAGQRHFGENRVQEAQGKWPVLKNAYSDVALHLIGPLQTNKVAAAVGLFDAIHTLDRDKLAAALSREMARQGRTLTLFVQVNIGKEPQKAGIAPEETVEFVRRCRTEHGLSVTGLMCIPPAEADPAPFFRELARMAADVDVRALSMGMSGDYEAAVVHGATHVRVGSALFGPRPTGHTGTE